MLLLLLLLLPLPLGFGRLRDLRLRVAVLVRRRRRHEERVVDGAGLDDKGVGRRAAALHLHKSDMDLPQAMYRR